MQVASVGLVTFVGGRTLLTNDARFVFWKVSAAVFVVGCAMLRPGGMRRHIPPIAAEHLPPAAMTPWVAHPSRPNDCDNLWRLRAHDQTRAVHGPGYPVTGSNSAQYEEPT